jgi:predicted nucleic acid-binding protein
VLAAAARAEGLGVFGAHELIAPPLLWPEARSALHVAFTRNLVSEALARQVLDLLDSGALKERRHRRLGARAWSIATDLGWSKTYDAEYLALAALVGGAVVTFDRRVRRAAERLGLAAEVDLA